MDRFTVKFGTAKPIRFTEPRTGEEYEALINGLAFVNEYDMSLYASDDDVTAAIRSNVSDIVEESLKCWPADDIMSSKKEALLSSFLASAYEKTGIKGDFNVMAFVLTEASRQKYNNSRGMGLFNMGMITGGQPKLSDLTPEEHGPVVEIVSVYSSHGMSMGSGTSGREVVAWQTDGSVLIESSDSRNGNETYDKNIAGREAAEKLRDYVRESHVAEMAQVKPIPSPFVVMDHSSSSYITFTFEDGKDGTSVRVDRRLDCGSCWELQSQTIKKIRELILDCINTGKCLEHKENSYDPAKPGMAGSMGMSIGSWKCSCGADNTGRFCANCGNPKPSGKWKCPNCNTENEGRFCTECATARP